VKFILILSLILSGCVISQPNFPPANLPDASPEVEQSEPPAVPSGEAPPLEKTLITVYVMDGCSGCVPVKDYWENLPESEREKLDFKLQFKAPPEWVQMVPCFHWNANDGSWMKVGWIGPESLSGTLKLSQGKIAEATIKDSLTVGSTESVVKESLPTEESQASDWVCGPGGCRPRRR